METAKIGSHLELAEGFEPTASDLQKPRSARLSYASLLKRDAVRRFALRMGFRERGKPLHQASALTTVQPSLRASGFLVVFYSQIDWRAVTTCFLLPIQHLFCLPKQIPHLRAIPFTIISVYYWIKRINCPPLCAPASFTISTSSLDAPPCTQIAGQVLCQAHHRRYVYSANRVPLILLYIAYVKLFFCPNY